MKASDDFIFCHPRTTWTQDHILSLVSLSPSRLSQFAGSHERIDSGNSLLTVPHLQVALYAINTLLAVEGELVVHCDDTSDQSYPGRRIGTQIQYSLGTIFPDCYQLRSNHDGRLVFLKTSEGRAWATEFRSASIGFITDGRELKHIERNLEILEGLREVLELEVFLVGPSEPLASLSKNRPWVRIIGDFRHEDVRGPISRKKGLIIDKAAGENLVLVHDRFLLDAKFWQQLMAFGNDFDFYNCRHCSLGDYPGERRVQGDYGFHTAPIAGFSFDSKSGSCEYGQPNPFFYNNGGLFVGKLKWFKGDRWPLHLHWSDLEDVHFTWRCSMDGAVWRHDWGNRVFTTNRRMGYVVAPGIVGRLKRDLRYVLRWLRFRQQYSSSIIH